MKLYFVVLLCCGSLLAQGQIEMNVDQLGQFVRSELALKQHTDKQIAAYLKKVKLTEKLPDKAIQDLEAQGAGPKTMAVLQELETQTASKKTPSADTTFSPGTAPESSGQQSAPSVSMGVHQPIPPPNSVRQQEILDEIRQYAMNYTANLPNFVCLQVTRRYVDPNSTGSLHLIDTINTQLSYNQGSEQYRVVSVNGKLMNIGMEDVGSKVGGSISTGEFGSLMRSLFDTRSAAEFNWDHWGTLRGKRVAVFNYSIDSGHSDYHITYDNAQQIITAYRGLVYADEYTGVVSRITFEAVNIPKSFPVNAASERLDYDEVTINGNPYMCPLTAKVNMAAGLQKTQNDIEFRLYRKFGTESNVTYGALVNAPAPLPENQTQEQPAEASPVGKPRTPARANSDSQSSNPFKLPEAPSPPPQ